MSSSLGRAIAGLAFAFACTTAAAQSMAFINPGKSDEISWMTAAVLFDNVALEEAMARAEGFRHKIYELNIPHAKSAHGRVTLSIGASSIDPGELPAYVARGTAISGTAEMLGRADQALYEAKAAGRNRVVGIAFASSEAIQTRVLTGAAVRNPVKQ